MKANSTVSRATDLKRTVVMSPVGTDTENGTIL